MDPQDESRIAGMLDVGGGQQTYWEEWGAPEGVPALYLHGGPGGGLSKGLYRNRFALARTRVVGFEQRGCGRSLPHASEMSTSLEANTTDYLIHDMERLREFLGVDAWIISGVSWGSTLALAYAQTHPERVRGLVLVAVTTTSRREVDWITEGVGAVFPEASSGTRVGTRSASGSPTCVSPLTTGPMTGSASRPSSPTLSVSEVFRTSSSMVGVISHRPRQPHGSCTEAGPARSSWLTRAMVTAAPG